MRSGVSAVKEKLREGTQQVVGVLGRDDAGGGQCVCLHRMACQPCSAA